MTNLGTVTRGKVTYVIEDMASCEHMVRLIMQEVAALREEWKDDLTEPSLPLWEETITLTLRHQARGIFSPEMQAEALRKFKEAWSHPPTASETQE